MDTAEHRGTILSDPEESSLTAGDKSTAELLADFSRELTSLVHHEIELTKTEMLEKGKRAGLGAGFLGAGAVAGLLAAACFTATAIAAISLAIPVWAAALAVGFSYLVVAGTAALAGRKELVEASPPIPGLAMESAKEDVAWLKLQTKSAKR